MKVTVAFFKGDNDLSDKLVKWWTNSKYSHCEMIIQDKWLSADPKRGVRLINLKPLKDNWDYVEVEVDEKNTPFVLSFISEQKGKKYDWKGIFFSQLFSFDLHSHNKFFCSELVMGVLQAFNASRAMGKKPHKFSPGDVFNLLNS